MYVWRFEIDETFPSTTLFPESLRLGLFFYGNVIVVDVHELLSLETDFPSSISRVQFPESMRLGVLFGPWVFGYKSFSLSSFGGGRRISLRPYRSLRSSSYGEWQLEL
ncbi:MAG: hypothetical protein FRX48_00380 [Lasallia pustulata]|uniref:Uncharacterized protein n=1 Tax=Lasallia pustulata TaxID=136370 RepID=A0A5M8Q3A4_9LECA|nr:MAG: hypothetical protein FRX48_00380 [Lasallia pustulata]